jgi:hypothetical protein
LSLSLGSDLSPNGSLLVPLIFYLIGISFNMFLSSVLLSWYMLLGRPGLKPHSLRVSFTPTGWASKYLVCTSPYS